MVFLHKRLPGPEGGGVLKTETDSQGTCQTFSYCFCACVYWSLDALFFDNRRNFTEMGQTDFKPWI